MSLLLASLSLTSGPCRAFLPVPREVHGCTSSDCPMVGGRGWDNDDYLDGLGGNDDDRRKVEKDYQDFQERRAAFDKRQREYLKSSPQAQAFLKQQQQDTGDRDGLGDADEDMDDEISSVQPGSGGGSRMAQMMAQAKRIQQPKRNDMFEQKLAPVDDVDTTDD